MKKQVWMLFITGILSLMVVGAQGGEIITDDGTARLRNPNTSQNVGYDFTVGSTPLTVSALGVWDDADSDAAGSEDGATGGTPDGLTGNVTVRLWGNTSATTGTKLAQVTIIAGTDPSSYVIGEFRYKALATPVSLKANTTYQVSVQFTSTDDLFHHFQLADTSIDFISSSYVSGFVARFTAASGTFLEAWAANNESVATGKAFISPNLLYDFRTPSNPSPDGSELVDPDGLMLSWTTGQDPDNVGTAYSQIRKHYLFATFNNTPEEPNLVYIGEIDAGNPTELTASYGPLTLERNRTYFWQIEEGLDDGAGGVYPPSDPNNNILGPVWSFDTLLSTPEIDENTPADTHGAVTNDVQLMVSAINPFTGNTDFLVYQWYIEDPNDIVPLTNGSEYSNVDTDTLTVLSIDPGDAGYYYCIVTNSQNATASESRHAYLSVDRLIGHWPLDGDLLDYNLHDEKHDGVLETAAYDADAKAGQSLKLTNDEVTISSSTEFFNIHPFGYTISCWVKSAQTATDNWILRKRGTNTGFGLYRTSSGLVQHYLANRNLLADDFVSDNQWHLLTGTFNAETRTLRLFIDGEAKIEALNIAPGGTNISDLILGGFTGLLDDVRIYNYALNLEDVANLYLELVPDGEVCTSALEGIIGDLNGDCKVDIIDFSILAGNWLECDLLPVSVCE